MKNKNRTIKMMVLILGIIIIGVSIAVVARVRNAKKFDKNMFGENVIIFSPEDDPAYIQNTLDELYAKQEANQFGDDRYAVYFLPGEYDDSIEVNVGFYTQVAGLGKLPTDTKIANLKCLARWLSDDPSNNNACCNFWRSLENIEIKNNVVWAVSQATDVRRVKFDKNLYLHDEYGWCSGGFLADSQIDNMIDSGSQQQWLSRNNTYPLWVGENWNIVFQGDDQQGKTMGTWPAKSYTTVEKTDVSREKPFLVFDERLGYGVFVPSLRRDSVGPSWTSGEENGGFIPIKDFYIAQADKDNGASINKAICDGKNVLFTPGIYDLEEPICVPGEETILLGTGLATLRAKSEAGCLNVGDEDGIIIAGLLFDAGEIKAQTLMTVGDEKSEGSEDNTDVSHSNNPIILSDLFFRIGGTNTKEPTQVNTALVINSNEVVGDNFWIWRADHGDQVAWDKNVADTGLVVNGDNVSIDALMVEHFEKYQTIWNGNNGKIIMYQCEIPYDVPSQEVWKSHDGERNGYASIHVDDNVEGFEAIGLGIYLYNRDAAVELYTPVELPDKAGVKVHNICTVYLTGNPGMSHIINDSGNGVFSPSQREIIIDYEDGLIK